MSVQLDRKLVDDWSREYVENMGPVEAHLFGEIHPLVVTQGHYSKAQLLEVGYWKSPRVRSRLDRNAAQDVVDITAMAFGGPAHLRHRVLTLLEGVQVAVASALLTVWEPTQHTIIDFRSLRALETLGHLTQPCRYVDYLDICRRIAQRLGIDLRTLDRALWHWDKAGRPTTW